MLKRLAVPAQYLLPKRLLTMTAGKLANWHGGRASTALIGAFVKHYQVNMQEAAQPDIASYACFNDFFSRALRPGVRPLAPADLICPVDGTISQFGAIQNGQIFQAKGHSYSCTALLAGDAALAAQFADGHFATLYLSPRDYHRIHMPCAGKLRCMTHVPGTLFSVNPATARAVPGLFARNERVLCVFDSAHGTFVLALVGATIVGSIATAWHGVVQAGLGKQPTQWRYDDASHSYQQGQEMGRFLLGSTVVVLLPPDALRFNPNWQASAAVQLGQAMAWRTAI